MPDKDDSQQAPQAVPQQTVDTNVTREPVGQQLTERPLLTEDMNPNTAVKHWLSSVLPTSSDREPPEKK
jgi:hypothetical protein